MRTPLRVLMVTARFLPDVGGTETHVFETARRLVRHGINVTVLTTTRSRELAPSETVDGIAVRRVRAWPRRRDWYIAPGVARIVSAEPWDLVHCQGIHTAVPPLAMLAARRARRPYLVTFHSGGHSSRVRTSLRGVQWRLLRPLLKDARRLIAVSNFEAEAFRQRLEVPSDRFTTIPNGAGLPMAQVSADPDLIVSIGRLERYKGHQRVLAALPHVLCERPSARLRIVGDGPFAAELRRLAVSLGVQHRVEIGPIPAAERAAMANLLASAGLVTLLSDYEAHPVAVMEALALGRPVLVAETSGLAELAHNGLVRGVAPDASPLQTGRAMLDALELPSSVKPVELPSWEGCASQLLDVYQESVCAS